MIHRLSSDSNQNLPLDMEPAEVTATFRRKVIAVMSREGLGVTNKVVAKLGMIFGEVFYYISSSIT